MYNGLIHAHSGWRWLVLILLVTTVLLAFSKKETFYKKLNLFTLIASHIQLIFGLILLFISPKVQFSGEFMKNAVLRFYTIEHTVLMLLAILLITLGYGKAKRAINERASVKMTRLYYGFGLLLILISIPWPFRNLGAGWF
jgi:uncharacterized protein YacL